MKQNLDTLKNEILEQLEARSFTVFYGFSRLSESHPAVYWDTNHHPDFRMFLEAARQLGVKLVTFHHREFSREAVDDAMDRLEDCDVSADDRQILEHRLHDVRVYDGFTCSIELSFDHQGRLYLYSLHTSWYTDFLDIIDEIDSYIPGEQEEDDEGPIGGYFSRN